MNIRGGFTLVELIVVVVILGILAATVAPKFADLHSEAKVATLKGLKGSYESVLRMVTGEAVVQGKGKDKDKDKDKDKAGCANVRINSAQCPGDMSSPPCANSRSDIEAYPGVVQL